MGRYTDINALWAIMSMAFWAAAVVPLAVRREARKLAGVILHTFAFAAVLFASASLVGGLLSLAVCYAFLRMTLSVEVEGSGAEG